MQYVYDPYIIRRTSEGRIFLVNAKMTFEHFVWCFQNEQPFFMVSQLEDGRVAITPNATFIPLNLLQAGYWPQDLLPADQEYVTLKQGTYPVIISAHPVANFEDWYRRFTRCVEPFAKQTLDEFVSSTGDFKSIELMSGTRYPATERIPA
jgi:hypothetical protein